MTAELFCFKKKQHRNAGALYGFYINPYKVLCATSINRDEVFWCEQETAHHSIAQFYHDCPIEEFQELSNL